VKGVDDDGSVAGMIGGSLQRTLEVIAEAARREGFEFDAAAVQAGGATEPAYGEDLERHRQDPLAISAREYGQLAWRIGRAILPIAGARGDAPLLDAVETIEWFSSIISSKVYRAICGQEEGWEGSDEAQTDFNGSAKMALIGIGESRRAWLCSWRRAAPRRTASQRGRSGCSRRWTPRCASAFRE